MIKIIDDEFKAFRYVSMDYFQDIETNEYYMLCFDDIEFNKKGY